MPSKAVERQAVRTFNGGNKWHPLSIVVRGDDVKNVSKRLQFLVELGPHSKFVHILSDRRAPIYQQLVTFICQKLEQPRIVGRGVLELQR